MPPPHSLQPPSPGLLLYTEGNKDTRRISVVCLTKWVAREWEGHAHGLNRNPAQLRSALSRSPPPAPPPPPPLAWASLRSALSQGALWMCDRLWVGEFMLMLKRQRTQTDNPQLKRCCGNFPAKNKGTCVQTVKLNSITHSGRAYFPLNAFPQWTQTRTFKLFTRPWIQHQ